LVCEKAYYNHENNSCTEGKSCGHYTQMVWKDTSKLGCAKAQYGANSRFYPNGWVIVCKYQTVGNFNGQSPY
jgi:pathogenesis-related protein 1